MGASQSNGLEFWANTRTFMRIWRGMLCAFLMAFFFYAPAIKYEQTYTANCAAPGTLLSQIWSWDFVLQAFYAIFLILLLWSSGDMLIEWHAWKPYVWFLIINAITLLWLLSTGIYLAVEASRANTVNSGGNVFNDFRACCVYGSLPAYATECFLTGACTPGLTQADLGINGPRIFQLVFHIIFLIWTCVSMIYVPTAYKASQVAMGQLTRAEEEPLLDSSSSSNGNNDNEVEPTSSHMPYADEVPRKKRAQDKRRIRVANHMTTMDIPITTHQKTRGRSYFKSNW